MKYINSIKTSLLIIVICFCTFCSGYTMGSSFVFADSTTDNWTQVTTNAQLVEAFRYYCKSRDLTIEGSIADGVTQFTTQTFNGICNSLGIDVTALQAHLKYETDSNLGLRFLFDTTGISAYNRIFAQFLQDNELAVGDTANQQNNTVFNGHYWTCDGYTSLCYELDYVNSNYVITVRGTPFAYDTERLKSITPPQGQKSSVTIKFDNSGEHTFTWNVQQFYVSNINYWVFHDFNNTNHNTNYLFAVSNDPNVYAIPMVIYYNNYYYWGRYYTNDDGVTNGRFQTGGLGNSSNKLVSTSGESGSVNIFLTTNNTVINNNNYEGDTIINNNGTPTGPSVPTPTPEPDYNPAEDWDIDLPDLSVPNWILSGKENKFPFDIPFNVMYALSLLQAEPEAPRVEGTLDFGFTTWEYDLDLSDFDTVAEICRDMEFLAFLTGLMLMTRKLIWG